MEMPQNKTLFLFSSSQREIYKKDNIDAVCYPEDYIFHFRYEEKYVSESVKHNINSIEGMSAFVVIVSIISKDAVQMPHFTPIRKCICLKPVIEGAVYHFYFKVIDEWVDYGLLNNLKDYSNQIDTLVEKPISTTEGFLTGKFVTFETISNNINCSKDTNSWDVLVKKLGTLDDYKTSLFCRLKLTELKTKKPVHVKVFDIYTSGYEIENDKKYTLELVLRIGNDRIDTKDRLSIQANNEMFYTPIPDKILLGRVDKQTVLITPKKKYDDEYSKLSITIENNNESREKLFNFDFTIPVLVKFSKIKFYTPVFLYFIGIIITSGICYKDAIVQFIGSLISTAMIFVLFKKI